MLMQPGCTTSEKNVAASRSALKYSAEVPIALPSEQPPTRSTDVELGQPKSKSTPLNPVTTVPKRAEINHCREILQRFGLPYKRLFDALPPHSIEGSKLVAKKIAHSDANTCEQLTQRRELIQSALDTINLHSGKVGVLLPLTGPYAKDSNNIVAGMRASFSESGKSFDQKFILKDSGTSLQSMDKAIAELVLKDQVGLVIGGFTHTHAEHLAQWSERLFLPVILLNRDRNLTKPSRYAFMVYPDEARLADSLATAIHDKRLRKVAILKPLGGKADKVTTYFTQSLRTLGGEIQSELTYTPGNFESMQVAAHQLFQMSVTGREDELRAAHKKAKEVAEAEGVTFNPKMVFLKPKIEFDALFIPDDFRTVRYFAKIFRYNRVERITMIGNHEWRSPALIQPYDDLLGDSLFADFIGSYAKIPTGIQAPTTSSPYFVDPQSVTTIDFQLVGYRSAQVAKASFDSTQTRRQIATAMAKMTAEQVGFPGKGRLFDDTRHSAWPTYLFTIHKDGLKIEASNPRGLSAKSVPPDAKRG
jgi:hypothetical protein